MKQYIELLNNVLLNGQQQANRTGIDTLTVPGAMLQFDLNDGFPAVTTKKLAFKSGIGEMIGFLRGYDNAADFRRLGCNFWNQNANENEAWLANPNRKCEDDLGAIYGVQWRHWLCQGELGPDGKPLYFVDQLRNVFNTILTDPTNRRIIINGWNPGEFSKMSLPPCHLLYQFIVNVERKELNLCLYQRSCDLFLGVPLNISGGAFLLSLVAAMTGLKPRHFTHFLADAHIYVNHIEQVKEQISRSPYPLPTLELQAVPRFSNAFDCIDFIDSKTLVPDMVNLLNYQYHPAIKAPMAV